jgi:hypothetical protein
MTDPKSKPQVSGLKTLLENGDRIRAAWIRSHPAGFGG